MSGVRSARSSTAKRVHCAGSDITPVLPERGSVDLASEDRANRLTGVETYAIDPDMQMHCEATPLP